MPRSAWIGTLGVLIGAPAWAATQAPSGKDDLAAGVIRDLGLQTQLPQLPRLPPPTDFSLRLRLPDIVLWLVVAGALAVLLYFFKDLTWRTNRNLTGPGDVALPTAAHSASHIARADAYADQGLFIEAMHELLLQGFGELRARADGALADSLTSREILRSAALPEQGRAALRVIVQRVERTWFGEHAATRADYLECRSSFEALTAALRQARA